MRSQDPWRAVALSFVQSRAVLLAVTAIGAAFWRRSPLEIWNQWDARWYLGIAAHGYHWSIGGKSALAFFPLYPLLIRAGTALHLPAVLAAMLVANAAFAGALFYLYRLVEGDSGPDSARRSLSILALFPAALFTFAPYSESLYLLFTIAAMVHARRRQALLAGAWAAGAVLTRSVGLAVLVAVIAYLWREPWKERLLALLPSIAGLSAYGLYLTVNGFSLASILTAQRSWHRGLTYPWTGFTSSVSWLLHHAPGNPPWALENGLSLAITLFFLGLTVAAWRQLDVPVRLYCVGFWLLVLSSPEWLDGYYAPFSSMIRFVLALFPLAGWAAARFSPAAYRIYVVGSGLLMAGATTVYLAGGWVG